MYEAIISPDWEKLEFVCSAVTCDIGRKKSASIQSPLWATVKMTHYRAGRTCIQNLTIRTYLCNIFYLLVHLKTWQTTKKQKASFLHLPTVVNSEGLTQKCLGFFTTWLYRTSLFLSIAVQQLKNKGLLWTSYRPYSSPAKWEGFYTI